MNPPEINSSFETLCSSFATFRSRYGTRARIPKHLRQAVFTALESGLDQRDLTKALGLSRTQIAVWRRGKVPVSAAVPGDGSPRILDVIAAAEKEPSGFRVSYKSRRLSLDFTF